MKGKELPGVKVWKGTVRTGMNTHKWGGLGCCGEISQAAPCWKSKRLSLEKEDVAFCSLEGFASAFPPPTVRRGSQCSQYIPVESRIEDKNEGDGKVSNQCCVLAFFNDNVAEI